MAAQVIGGAGSIATGYVGISGQPTNTSIAKSTILAGSATLRNLYVTTQDPTGGGSVTVTTRKNGATTTSTVTINAGNVSGADNTHTVSGVLGDVIDWVVSLAGGAVSTTVSISMEMD
jgi:hypothetical protein